MWPACGRKGATPRNRRIFSSMGCKGSEVQILSVRPFNINHLADTYGKRRRLCANLATKTQSAVTRRNPRLSESIFFSMWPECGRIAAERGRVLSCQDSLPRVSARSPCQAPCYLITGSGRGASMYLRETCCEAVRFASAPPRHDGRLVSGGRFSFASGYDIFLAQRC